MKNFNQFLNKELNEPQKKAVSQKKGSVIVIAGAGSGKTRVITSRIANLIINENELPSSIVALTFTNKAANEMKNRLINFFEAKYSIPFVGTFHSYCLLLLRSNPQLLPYPQFSILDSDDQKSLIKKILKKNGLEKHFSASDLCYQISNYKNRLHTKTDEDVFSNKLLKEIFLAYETEKSMSRCLDFDDLILTVLKILQNNNRFKNSLQNKIKHILIDEYQDTNMVQHELIKCISLSDNKKLNLKSICAVGDEDQSIYSWRGAVATNMLKFQKDFSPVTLIKIEQNYRSVQPILCAANKVISNNKTRTPKNLWSQKKGSNCILSITCRSDHQEASAIAYYLSSLSQKIKLNQIAILYRTHFQSRNIEEELIRHSINYKIIGGIRFYERKEIKDLIAYLRLIVNPFDRTSLFRIINCPPRGLGAKFEELLYKEWNQNTLLNIKQILDYMLTNTQINLSYKKKEALVEFLDLLKKLKQKHKTSEIINKILEKTNYLNFLKKSFDKKDAESKIENVHEFVQSIHDFEKIEKKNSLNMFLEKITLMQEKLENNQDIKNQVLCMTLHASKGLEFDTVIITGLEEGLFPSYRSFTSLKDLEEERRLFYVGITRAKKRLILLRAQTRNIFGQIGEQEISQFSTEIPQDLVQEIEISEFSESKIVTIFKKWQGENKKSVLTFKDFSKLGKTQTKRKNGKEKSPSKQKETSWKKNRLVSHKKFGVGLIKKVKHKDNDTYYITVNFKCGSKTIISNFLNLI
ncbi:UvrD-helicase domain-containing protein [Candidatus Babeliales bacterium]|nr:UvrD-helicase domain-containing protein [Candidatus Babeliales bacterium]